MDKKAERKRIP